MKIGYIQNLKIKKLTDIGAYLVTDENGEVLLPKKQVSKSLNVGDTVEVFLYNDSKSRPIATTKKPFLQVGEIARLTVVDVNDIGAFLNIGLERDLLLPFAEQKTKVNVGDKVDVIMYIDKSNRLCASTYLNKNSDAKKIKNKDIRTFEYAQNADKVYKIIKEKFHGHLIYTDKTASPADIKRDFNMSKGVFKDSIGKLLKDDKIKISEKGIFLYY